jgi:hypothetical protein
VSKENPLVARVVINRMWQNIFGVGLVKTSEDFGVQGERPSHPELLDWLAVEFMESGWDMKAMLELVVSSATYRQATEVTSLKLQKDPENRLLSRGARYRLDAEAIRDNALSVSGLLDLRVGGKSVYPYQRAGLWREKLLTGYGMGAYPTSKGADQYRRGLYAYLRRSVPYPTFASFDTPSREYCSAYRQRTNTPLQALLLLNDPVFVEAARVFGERIMKEGGKGIEERIDFGFRLCTARPPSKRQRALLVDLFKKQLQVFSSKKDDAVKLVAHGQAPHAGELDTSELAAWTAVANVLLSLDQTITRGD